MIVKMWVNDSENGWVNDPEIYRFKWSIVPEKSQKNVRVAEIRAFVLIWN
jgi:hypothetical protein